MINDSDILMIGTIVRTHGKQGELQCRTTNEYWDDAEATFLILRINAIPVPFRVLDWRVKGQDLLFTLKGITTEEQALALVGCEVSMLRSDIANPEEQVLLSWQDIVGYRIGEATIEQIDDSTANVLAQLSDGRLVPLHEDLITDIDHDQRIVTMNLPEGL
ncbi:MAG: hypothetical protein MJZ59_04760 [Paludibacteraceae bacterium]|nr:hypothetical protein [Paludibacteraceae bacterium]